MQLIGCLFLLPFARSIGAAWPSHLFHRNALDPGLTRRVVTPDNTCGSVGAGAGNKYTCDTTLFDGGSCCSANGYCGSTSDYCSTGCQPDFGTCDNSTSPGTTPDNANLCGPNNSGLVCADGACCSIHGYCGITTDYCLPDNCNANYGNCTTGGAGSIPSGDGQCGPEGDGASCPSGLCCSAAGWCGTGIEYCADPDCQHEYGVCDSNNTPAGNRTDGVARPLVGDVTYTDDIYDCRGVNTIALSYDDGPYEYTSELLDLLDEYGFKATFFITGNNLGKGSIDTTAPYPELIQRMISSGHQVASHTWSHYSLSNVSQSVRIDQMIKNEMAFVNIIGKYPTYMRPPYSQCDAASGCQADLQSLGYHRVYFDLDTEDYLNPLATQIQNSKTIVQQALARKDVDDYLSIQHDIVQQSVTNLTAYYYGLIRAKGWKGVAVGTCLEDPEENWYRRPDGSSGAVASHMSSSSTSAVATSSTKTVQGSSSMRSTQSTTRTTSSIARSLSASTKTKSVTSDVAPAYTQDSTAITSKAASPSATKATPTQPTSHPASSCIGSAGGFCGTIQSFSDAKSCKAAVANCNVQLLACPWEAGWAHVSTCSSYGIVCSKLSSYCLKCRTDSHACSEQDFLE